MENEIISKISSHGFWFIDIPRTSSSSIKVELGMEFGPPYGKENLLEKEFSTSQVIPDHIPAVHAKKYFGSEVWEGLYTFAFVRNPWDRMLSMYFYRLQKGHYSDDLTFREYIIQLKKLAEGQKSPLFAYHGFYLGCSAYIFEGGKSLVNFVGRYENRQSDLLKVSAAIHCPDLGKIFVQKSKGRKEHYSHYYDEETAEIIRALYRQDIEQFGYEFQLA